MEVSRVCGALYYCAGLADVFRNLSDRRSVFMMNSWQEWVVALLLLLCAVRIGMSIYSFSHRVKENGNPCDSCASGCELKNLYDKKRAECSGVTKKKKKSCCG